MTALEARKVGPGLVMETEQAEELWAHEVIEELKEDEALEAHFQDCIASR